MADINLSFKISSEKVERAKEGFLKIYPNTEKIEDTETKKYTDLEWIKEKIRRLIVRDIRRGLEMKRKEEIEQIEDTDKFVL